jgi:hypothetical protein
MSSIKGMIWGFGFLFLAACGPHDSETADGIVPKNSPDDFLYFKEKIRKYPDSLYLYQVLVDTLANRGLYAAAAAWCVFAQAASVTVYGGRHTVSVERSRSCTTD